MLGERQQDEVWLQATTAVGSPLEFSDLVAGFGVCPASFAILFADLDKHPSWAAPEKSYTYCAFGHVE